MEISYSAKTEQKITFLCVLL